MIKAGRTGLNRELISPPPGSPWKSFAAAGPVTTGRPAAHVVLESPAKHAEDGHRPSGRPHNVSIVVPYTALHLNDLRNPTAGAMRESEI